MLTNLSKTLTRPSIDVMLYTSHQVICHSKTVKGGHTIKGEAKLSKSVAAAIAKIAVRPIEVQSCHNCPHPAVKLSRQRNGFMELQTIQYNKCLIARGNQSKTRPNCGCFTGHQITAWTQRVNCQGLKLSSCQGEGMD